MMHTHDAMSANVADVNLCMKHSTVNVEGSKYPA